MTGTKSCLKRSAILIGFSMVVILFLSVYFVSTEASKEARSRAAPEGYIELSDLVSQGKITLSGGEYIVSGTIDIPSSTPLYVGPGQTVLFHEDAGLTLRGPPVFEGTIEEPVVFGRYTPGQNWKGIVVSEADLETPSYFNNVTITGAEKGIWSMGADLKITDCTISDMNNSGLVLGGPLGSANTVEVRRTTISNAYYYGISTLDLESLQLNDVDIIGSGTGLRSVRSMVRAEGLFITDSPSMGIYSYQSTVELSSFSISSGEHNSTNIQVLVTDSGLSAHGGFISGSRVGVHIMVDSNVYLDDVEVSDCFKDGIRSDNSTIGLELCSIHDNTESGLDLRGTDFSVKDTSLANNGEGSGSFAFSTFYLSESKGEVQGCDIRDSGYSHLHGVGSKVNIGNSTYDEGGVTSLTLDDATTLTFINNHPPDDIEYLDIYSRIRYLVVQVIEVRNYTSGAGIPGSIVDIEDRTGTWIGSFQSDESGSAGPAVILAYSNTSDGSFNYFPIKVMVQSAGYELLSMSVPYPLEMLEIDMYPPNSPPELTLYAPVNGDQFDTGTLQVEGSIQDDLGIFKVKVRFDSGGYSIFDLGEDFGGGNFEIVLPLDNISTGTHDLEVRGFDGVHDSSPETRHVYVLNPAMADSDGDGLLDSEEDLNGNGQVDEGETDPNNPDTDGDGLSDGLEMDDTDGNTTDPLNEDTDGDFILDGQEDLNRNGQVDEGETDPNNPDTDGDGVIDSKDKYPLNPDRWSSPEERGDDLLLVLIMAVLLLILLAVLAYIVFIKADVLGKGIRKDKEEHREHTMSAPVRRAPRRVPEAGSGGRRAGTALPRREGRHGDIERKRGWR